MSNYTQRQETIDALASMVIEQADRHGFKIEIDAIRDAVEQMAKFAGIEANETEFMLASQKVEDEARLMGKLSEKSGVMSNYIEQAPATKLVEVRLSALTRVEYMEVVEVPANITQAELDDLVNARYRQVDGGEFTSDPEYWERGTCEAVETDMPNTAPSMMAFRTAHGLHIERADAAAQTVESSGPTP